MNVTILDRGLEHYHVTNVSLDDGLLAVSNMLNDKSNIGDSDFLVSNGNDGLSFYESSNFYFSKKDEIVNWVVANLTCQQAMQRNDTYACVSHNSYCENIIRGKTPAGYRCMCSDGFQGNPYLHNNCKGHISLLNHLYIFHLSNIHL